eukprot:3037988-Rhodomonas_salina.1
MLAPRLPLCRRALCTMWDADALWGRRMQRVRLPDSGLEGHGGGLQLRSDCAQRAQGRLVHGPRIFAKNNLDLLRQKYKVATRLPPARCRYSIRLRPRYADPGYSTSTARRSAALKRKLQRHGGERESDSVM